MNRIIRISINGFFGLKRPSDSAKRRPDRAGRTVNGRWQALDSPGNLEWSVATGTFAASEETARLRLQLRKVDCRIMHQVQPLRFVPVAAFAAVLVSIAMLNGGCAKSPQVILTEQRLGESTPEAQRVEFMVDIINPAAVPIELRQMDYLVRLDGSHVYRGRRAAQATVPAGGTVQVLLPAVVDAGQISVPAESPAFQISGSVSYITPGVTSRLLRDLGFPRSRVGFRAQIGDDS